MSRNGQPENTLAPRTVAVLTRRAPWAEFQQSRRQLDDVFGAFFGAPTAFRSGDDLSPDVFETKEEIVFVLPIPGVEPNEVSIEVTADTLSIRGERKPFFQAEGAVQHRQSWWTSRTGAFNLSYTLPVEINPDTVQARTHNGVLELHLPKAEAVRPKTIKVNVSEK